MQIREQTAVSSLSPGQSYRRRVGTRIDWAARTRPAKCNCSTYYASNSGTRTAVGIGVAVQKSAAASCRVCAPAVDLSPLSLSHMREEQAPKARQENDGDEAL